MRNLARWILAHRRAVIIGWIVLAVGGAMLSFGVKSKNSTDFTLAGTQSARAQALLNQSFKAQAGDNDQIVFHARSGTLSADRAVIDATLARVAALSHVVGVVSPFAPGQHAISSDGTIAFATVNFNQRAEQLPVKAIKRVISVADSASSSALQVELGGQAIEQAQGMSVGFATGVGILAAIVILLIAFGSFSAMVLPIATALVGLLAGQGISAAASHAIAMPSFASQLALMIGLGVGVDYSLFIVTRFRENYRTNGGDVDGAVEHAINSAGRAVIFAGVTVALALLGMLALRIKVNTGVGIASAISVALVMLSSVTLLPALLSLTGKRVGALKGRAASDAAAAGQFWRRWVGGVQRQPVLTGIVATVLMLALAAPALGLRLGLSDAGNDPAGHTTRKAYDLLAKGFGPGFNGPLIVAAALPRAGDTSAVTQLSQSLSSARGVASVAPAQVSPAGTTAVVFTYPTTSPQSQQTTDLVNRLRDRVIPPYQQGTRARVYIGGPTAAVVDFSHVTSSRLPVFVGVVIGVAMILLLIAFRSLVIPIQAAVMTMLSIGASYGIVQALFQRGWLGIFPKGPIDAFIPLLMFAVVFGLGMDYEVFLISRIREEWDNHHDASRAIREGIARTGRVITAAAAVMVAVFVAFSLSGERILEMFGIGMAAGVFLDALVIRMVMLPAVLQLLGRTTWTLPKWLDRGIPHVAVEPESAARPHSSLEPAHEPA
jgi:putative drug exporter of the RND superfamily